MSARIDYAAEARKTMSQTLSYGHYGEDAGAIVSMLAAQVHATLALVEQQRLANMQAERAELRRVAQGRTDDTATDLGARANVLSVHIREGLGL
ncbi:hypothetical protein [Microbacterium sp. YJN-G]|uniref:hypothetical protein n=1 Tax=Microbacterium sp. YJN-G TaxID=2763257 RepID=UPI001877993B|nr:hypothetical protein [Microbacterium sp. YJN-G]